MATTYEYKFVRIGENAASAVFGVRDKDRNAYEGIVHEHAERVGGSCRSLLAGRAFGAAKYYELIFRRETSASATPSQTRDDAEGVGV